MLILKYFSFFLSERGNFSKDPKGKRRRNWKTVKTLGTPRYLSIPQEILVSTTSGGTSLDPTLRSASTPKHPKFPDLGQKRKRRVGPIKRLSDQRKTNESTSGHSRSWGSGSGSGAHWDKTTMSGNVHSTKEHGEKGSGCGHGCSGTRGRQPYWCGQRTYRSGVGGTSGFS